MIVTNPQFSISDVRRSVCRESFYDFVIQFWDTIIQDPLKENWHIKYLCNEVQKVAEMVFVRKLKDYDLIINIFPGSTKSTICSVMLPPWCWTRAPWVCFGAASHTHTLALSLSLKSRDLVQSEKYQETFPEIQLRKDVSAKSYFANTLGGERVMTTTGSSFVGRHAHLWSVDDPIDPESALSEVDLATATRWMRNTLPSRKKEKSDAPTILIMQRLHQDDPTATMIEDIKEHQRIAIRDGDPNAPLKLKHICLPAEKTKDVKPKKLRRFYKNGLMDPIRMGKGILQEFMAKGEYEYAGQFLQNPIPRGGGMFKTDRIVIDIPPKKWLDRVRFWDKAGTTNAGSYTVGLLMGLDRDRHLWILDVIRGQWSSEIREQIIKQTAQMDTIDVIVGIEQEGGSGGKESAEATIKNLMGFRVKKDKPSGAGSSKEARADPFSVQVNSGNVSMIQAEWNKAYLNEMAHWPNSKYKDQGDASSGAFNMLMKGRRKKGPLW